MKKVSIKIKGGKVSADFTGFVGNACEQLQRKISPENFDVEHKELKPEYHFSAQNEQTDKVHDEWQ